MDHFKQILSRVQQTQYWAEMGNTVENSPWHREDNVQIHTMMTLAAYEDEKAPHRTDRQQLITKIALLMHDLGKPEAEETIVNDDGTDRRRYAGHELISANAFVDIITTNADIMGLLNDAGLDAKDLHAIRYMIEHHLPYAVEKFEKRATLKFNLKKMLGDDYVCFYDMLESDTRGRISDDQEAKIQAVLDWVAAFEQVDDLIDVTAAETMPEAVFAIGCAGSGKTTYFDRNLPEHTVISFDDERIQYTMDKADDIQRAWLKGLQISDVKTFSDICYEFTDSAAADFKNWAYQKFSATVKRREDMVIDKMNPAKKRRAQYVNESLQGGYAVSAIEFWIPLQTLFDRQHTRPDKAVPERAIRENYFAQQSASYVGYREDRNGNLKPVTEGEFHHITLVFPY